MISRGEKEKKRKEKKTLDFFDSPSSIFSFVTSRVRGREKKIDEFVSSKLKNTRSVKILASRRNKRDRAT